VVILLKFVSTVAAARPDCNFLRERVINVWNSLPFDVVDFYTLSAFKHCLEVVDLSKFRSLV